MNSNSKLLTIPLFILLFVLIGCVELPNQTTPVLDSANESGSGGNGALRPSGSESSQTTVNINEIPNGEQARVINIIDGDTIDVELNGSEYRLRYIGVDTPERDEPYYSDATALNRQLVRNQTVILQKDVSDTDRFGRLLRYVYLTDGTFVNAELLASGMARMVTFPPDVAMQESFRALQSEAQREGRGLWADVYQSGAPCDCGGNYYNCGDFDNRNSAQTCYEYCLAEVGEDIHRLDGGGDGLVCESLP